MHVKKIFLLTFFFCIPLASLIIKEGVDAVGGHARIKLAETRTTTRSSSGSTSRTTTRSSSNGSSATTDTRTANPEELSNTVVNTPQDVVSMANSQIEVTISWSPRGNPVGTEYLVENIRDIEQNSGWITATSYTFLRLVCGTTYTFGVKAQSATGFRSDQAQTSVTTLPCASPETTTSTLPTPKEPVSTTSTPIQPEISVDAPQPKEAGSFTCLPTNLVSVVENKDGVITNTPLVYTNRRQIGLKIDTEESSHIILRETRSTPGSSEGFEGKSFINNSNERRDWTLAGGEGAHFINVRFRATDTKPTQDTWACVVLDTVRPEPPVITEKDSGFITEGVLGRPILKGRAEPGTKIVITKKHTGSLVPTAPSVTEPEPEPPVLLASDLIFPLNEGTGCSLGSTGGQASALLLPSCVLGNAPTWSTASVSGSSIVFDGIDDGVNFGTVAPNVEGEMTIVGWFRPADGGLFPQTLFQYGALDDDIRLNRIDDTTIVLVDDINNANCAGSSIVIPKNEWIQTAVVLGLNGTKQLYLNGLLVSAEAGSALTATAIESPTLLFGNRNDNQTPFLGSLDQLSLFPRALSSIEIQGLYAEEGSGLQPASLARSWSMSEGSGCTVGEKDGWNKGTFDPSCGEGPQWIGDGIKGNALHFDGIDDRLLIAAEPALSFGTKDFSVSAWIRTTKADGWVPILGRDGLGKAGGGKGNGFVLFLNNGYFQPCYYFESGVCMNGTEQPFPKKTFLADGAWHAVTVTFDRDGAMRTFVDGVEYAVNTAFSSFAAVSLDAPNAPLRIGSRFWTASVKEFFSGDIDEVNIHDHILTNAEVANDYFAHKSLGTTGKGYLFSLNEESGCLSLDSKQGAVAELGPNCGSGNGPTWSSAAVSGRSVRFDGKNDVVSISGIAQSLVSGSGLSYSAWIRPEAVATPATIIGGTGMMSEIGILVVNGLPVCRTKTIALSGAQLPLNQWTHVVCVYDTVLNKTKMYVNGEAVASSPFAPSLTADATALIFLGNDTASTAVFTGFSGMIDEVELQPKALTSAEIQSMYADYTDTASVPPVEYVLGFNEGSGCVANGEPLIGTTKIAGILQPSCGSGNGPLWTTASIAQTALSFDGVDDGLVFEYSPTYDAVAMKDFSVSLWAKAEIMPVSDVFAVLASGGLTSQDGWILYLRNGEAYAQISRNGPKLPWLAAHLPFSPGKYHHIVATFQAKKNLLNLFVDGVKQTQIESQWITPVFGNAMSFGYRSSTNDKHFHGFLDEIRSYDRVITGGEVAELFAVSKALAGFSPTEESQYRKYQHLERLLVAAVSPKMLSVASHEEDSTYVTETDENGDWTFVFPAAFEEGNYTLAVHSEDSAGNSSTPVEEEMIVSATEETPSNQPQEEPQSCEPPAVLQDGVCTVPNEEPVCEEGTVLLDGACVAPWQACPNDQVYYEGECYEDTFTCPDGYVMRNDWCMAIEADSTGTGDQASGSSVSSPGASSEVVPSNTASSDTSAGSGTSGGTSSSNAEQPLDTETPEAVASEEDNARFIAREGDKKDEEVAGTIISRIVRQVTTAGTDAAVQVKRVIDNPEVEAVNENVIAPAVLAAAAANAAVGFRFAQIVSYLRFLFFQPILLIRRRKFKKWGTVYDAFTKLPIDLATVRVLDKQTGAVVRSQVTDTLGRYFILLHPGTYVIEVDKTGYKPTTEYLQGKSEDAKYINLLSAGASFTMTEEESEVNFSIPLEPEAVEKPATLVVREHTTRVAQHAMSLVGLGVSAASFVISPTPMIAAIAGGHVAFYGMFRAMAHKKLPDSFGVVEDVKTRQPIPGVVIRLFDTAYHKLVATAVTDRKGRYAILVGPSTFYVTYEKEGYRKQKTEVFDYTDRGDASGGLFVKRASLVSEK